MKRVCSGKLAARIARTAILAATLLLATSFSAMADSDQAGLSLQVGDRAPLFSVATNQDTLAEYDRDYYGRHHLVLTFFPAAFTPV